MERSTIKTMMHWKLTAPLVWRRVAWRPTGEDHTVIPVLTKAGMPRG